LQTGRITLLSASQTPDVDSREYLEKQFSGAAVLMGTVLRFLRHTTLVSDNPGLAAYQARCEARPAFKRALAAQLATFERHVPIAA
jgi:glutathione S-transferase